MEGLVSQVSAAYMEPVGGLAAVAAAACTASAGVRPPQTDRQSDFSCGANARTARTARLSVRLLVRLLGLTSRFRSQIQHLGTGGEHSGLTPVCRLRAEVR